MTVHQVFSSFSFYFFFVFPLFKIYKLNNDGHHPPCPYKIPVSQQQTTKTILNTSNNTRDDNNTGIMIVILSMSSQISIVKVKVETISMALFFIVAVVLMQQIHGPGGARAGRGNTTHDIIGIIGSSASPAAHIIFMVIVLQ